MVRWFKEDGSPSLRLKALGAAAIFATAFGSGALGLSERMADGVFVAILDIAFWTYVARTLRRPIAVVLPFVVVTAGAYVYVYITWLKTGAFFWGLILAGVQSLVIAVLARKGPKIPRGRAGKQWREQFEKTERLQ